MTIRYRVWDGFRMWMPGEIDLSEDGVSTEPIGYIVKPDGTLCEIWADYYNILSTTDNPKAKAMLSTGLKDKNGVEIFHSDIVRHSGLNRSNVGVVEDELVEFSVKFRWPGFVSFTFSEEQTLPQIEVIGNVHQHPELLEGK